MTIHKIAGIDYGNGASNTDHKTGIRYGVISAHSVNPEWLNDFEPHYPEIEHHSKCKDPDNCTCGDFLDPISFTYETDGIVAEYSPDSNVIMIFKSPVIVACRFCSPCYPGAGDLDNVVTGGIATYGLPEDCLNKE